MNIILALAITLAIEANLYMLLDYKNIKLFILVSLINIVSNVSMNILLWFLKSDALYYTILAIYEIGTVFIEALIVNLILKYKYTSALLFSFLANLASFITGLLVNHIVKTNTAMIMSIIIFMVIYYIGFAIFTYFFSKEYFKDK